MVRGITPFLTCRLPTTRVGRGGLQKSGYATDRAYANKLIKLIEDYELYRYDDSKYRGGVSRKQRRAMRDQETSRVSWTHQPYITMDWCT